MKQPYYKAQIGFKKRITTGEEGTTLDIEVVYDAPVTEQDIEILRGYYQWRIFQETGKNVPKEEIKVEPGLGEIRRVRTLFCTAKDRPLYAGVEPSIHNLAPYALPRLIEDLHEYKEKNILTKGQRETIDYTVNELEKIISKTI